MSTREDDGGQGPCHEADFAADADGDLRRPAENRAPGETLVHDVIAATLDLRG